MDIQQNHIDTLDLIASPGFCVKDGLISQINQAARALCIAEGTPVSSLLVTGQEEYESCSWEGLSLTLSIHGHIHSASVVPSGDVHIFLLEPEESREQYRGFALSAMELRGQLDSVMLSAESLSAECAAPSDAAARLNRNLFRMMRTIANMSDAERFTVSCHMQMQNICAFYDELFRKAQHLAEQAGFRLQHQLPEEDIWCLFDSEQLERAFWNLLSNAMKFTQKGSSIRVSLTRREHMLMLSVEDEGSGIPMDIRSTLFQRYLRQPGIEDVRYGIGLGMVLVRTAAAHHQGAVFVDQPSGTRVTMTMIIRQNTETVRCPLFCPDYAGGWDHGLLELSDCLPAVLYSNI